MKNVINNSLINVNDHTFTDESLYIDVLITVLMNPYIYEIPNNER